MGPAPQARVRVCFCLFVLRSFVGLLRACVLGVVVVVVVVAIVCMFDLICFSS